MNYLCGTLMGILIFLSMSAQADCGQAPLSDQKIREGYSLMLKISKMSPAEARPIWIKVSDEYSSPQVLIKHARKYVSKSQDYYLQEMRAYARSYRLCLARQAGDKAPECSGNYHCLSEHQCVGGKCERIGTTAGDCHYSSCSPGYRCTNEGRCE